MTFCSPLSEGAPRRVGEPYGAPCSGRRVPLFASL
jgi:hypothetical protein